MAKVFVTGIAGFLGSHLADALLAAGHEVSGCDNLLGGDPQNVPAGVKRAWLSDQADCTSQETMFRMLCVTEPAVVYHCAATPHEGLSVFSPSLVTHHTYASTVAVAAAAIRAGVKRLVFTSSAARYGRQHGPCVETMDPAPVDPYGIAKVAAEDTLRCLGDAHGMEYVIAVPHNIIGPRQKADDPFRNVAAITINRALQGKPPIVYGDGQQTRSFSFVDDCVGPLVQMGFEPAVRSEVINVGPDRNAVTIEKLARMILQLCDLGHLDPVFVADRPLEVKHVEVSAEKARRLLGYEAKVGLCEGLERMVAAMRKVGPQPFVYHLPIEIESERVPVPWRERLF